MSIPVKQALISVSDKTGVVELARALAGHPALWAWDLGNENSNCVVPPNKGLARDWLSRMAHAIRSADPAARTIDLATLGDDVLLRVHGNREDGGGPREHEGIVGRDLEQLT